MSTNSTRVTPRPDWTQWASLVVQTLGLFAVVLPAAGIAIRYLSFYFAGVEPAVRLAAAESTVRLAVTGVVILLWIGGALVIAIVYRAFARLDTLFGKRFGGSQRTGLAILGVATLLALLLIVHVPGWPTSVVLFATAGFGLFYINTANRRYERIPLVALWPLTVVLTVAGVAATVFMGRPAPTPAFVDFVDNIGVSDGWYEPLGTWEGGMFLRPCHAPGHRVTLVRRGDILRVEFLPMEAPPPSPSLWDVVVHEKDVGWGLRHRCPKSPSSHIAD